jgi:hypothetical protein
MKEAPQLVYDQSISSSKKLDWWPGRHCKLDQFFLTRKKKKNDHVFKEER